jgi:hypothetical protein
MRGAHSSVLLSKTFGLVAINGSAVTGECEVESAIQHKRAAAVTTS